MNQEVNRRAVVAHSFGCVIQYRRARRLTGQVAYLFSIGSISVTSQTIHSQDWPDSLDRRSIILLLLPIPGSQCHR